MGFSDIDQIAYISMKHWHNELLGNNQTGSLYLVMPMNIILDIT